jgi:hypothetical protein
MNFLSLARRLQWKFREQPRRRDRTQSKARLALELLETRTMPSVTPPAILGVTTTAFDASGQPQATTKGDPGGVQIVVQFNEAMDANDAANVNNYKLFASDGTSIALSQAGIKYNAATFTTTLSVSAINNGQQLVADTYTLFIEGDHVREATDTLFLSAPGQIVVANQGSGGGNVSTLSMSNTGPGSDAIGGPFNIDLAASGAITPLAMTLADVDGDGNPDMIIADGGTNSVYIFLGLKNGGFASKPAATLNLPLGVVRSQIIAADFLQGNISDTGALDIAVLDDFGPKLQGSVSVFLNNGSIPGSVQFLSGKQYNAGFEPFAMTVGHFNSDKFLDLAVADHDLDANKQYNVSFLPGQKNGTFVQVDPSLHPENIIEVGFQDKNGVIHDIQPVDLGPGSFINQNSAIQDVVVAGDHGIAVLWDQGSSGASVDFRYPLFPVFVPGGVIFPYAYLEVGDPGFNGTSLPNGAVGITHISVGRINYATSNVLGGYDDVVVSATGSQNANQPQGGGFFSLLDNAQPASAQVFPFDFTDIIGFNSNLVAPTLTGMDLSLMNPNPADTADQRSSLLYTAQESVLGGNGHVVEQPFRAGIGQGQGNGTIGSTGNDLVVGDLVSIGGFVYYVTAVAADQSTFSVTAPKGSGAPASFASGSAVDWILVPGGMGLIGTPAINGSTAIEITGSTDDMASGQQVTIQGATGYAALDALLDPTTHTATFFITVEDKNHFLLNGTVASGTPVANPVDPKTGAVPKYVVQPYVVRQLPDGLAVGDNNGDGIPDVATFSSQDLTASVLIGGANGNGQPNGTLLQGTNLSLAGGSGQPLKPVVADLNHDGIPDLVVPDQANNLVDVYLGLPGGGYAPAVGYSTVNPISGLGNGPDSVAIADVNGKKDAQGNPIMDLIVSCQTDSVLSIFFGDGKGGFTPHPATVKLNQNTQQKIPQNYSPTQVVVGDFNNDGIPDLAVALDGTAAATDRGVAVLIGKGDGNFLPPTFLDQGIEATSLGVGYFTTATDANGNPILDIAVTNHMAAGQVILNLGDGQGNFPNSEKFNVEPDPVALTVSDLNGDGFPDIVTISDSALTDKNIGVLINNVGFGFNPAVYTSLGVGNPLQDVTVAHVNQDAFPDLVVTLQREANSSTGFPNLNNIDVLTGNGGGAFTLTNPPVSANGNDISKLPPSDVTVVDDPFIPVTSFIVGGQFVGPNLIRNGSFEASDLAGEAGNLSGWTTYNYTTDANVGSAGNWVAQTGTTTPISNTTVPGPTAGRFEAVLDEANALPAFTDTFFPFQPPITASTYSGTHALYQDFSIPADAQSVTISMDLFLDSQVLVAGEQPWSDSIQTPQLNFSTTNPNQQVRVDLINPSANILDTGAGVELPIFQTVPNDPAGFSQSITVTLTGSTLQQFLGQTVRLRIATTNNQGKLNVAVDNVKAITDYVDTTPPSLVSVNLRNPSFLSGPSTSEQTTDQTLLGQVTDNGTINNIAAIKFDFNHVGFNNFQTSVLTQFDPYGNFSLTPTQPIAPGKYTVPIQITDKGGNTTLTSFTFIIQSPSLATWEAQGPEQTDISSQSDLGFEYSTVSGQITAIAYSPADHSGNTYYVGSDNGGVWKTTDGGNDYFALTDNVQNALGQRVPVPIASIAVGVAPSGQDLIYAATGVAFNTVTARGSVGILKSIDGGASWQVLGGGVFAGAHISKLAINPTNPNIVYVAVAWFDNPNQAAGVYQSTDGGQTWTDIMTGANMYAPGQLPPTGTPLGAGTALASVTDLLVDPFNPNRIIVGLGNIGETGVPSATAGVWLSPNAGGYWQSEIGGNNKAIGDFVNGVFTNNNFLPAGVTVGRVTLAQATGKAADEPTFYVLMANPPAGTAEAAPFSQGGELGLFKTKDNLLDFTQVMLKQQATPGDPFDTGLDHNDPYHPIYQDINLLGSEGSNFGSMAVDPTNANVVYIGGSDELPLAPSQTNPSAFLQHSVVRVDTSDMRDTTYVDPLSRLIPNDGDDIQKALAAEVQWEFQTASAFDPQGLATYYPPPGTTEPGTLGPAYTGEGVYWYDLQEAGVGQSILGISSRDQSIVRIQNLPGSINSLAVDSQGRVLFGTASGLYRGVPRGFGYDFVGGEGFGLGGTGNDNAQGEIYKKVFYPAIGGILAYSTVYNVYNPTGVSPISPPGMDITSLNGNLQIADLTSVAIDPTALGTFYTSQTQTGTAFTTSGVNGWATMGLIGPSIGTPNTVPTELTFPTPDAYQVISSAPAPNAAPGTPTTLYRVWEKNTSIAPFPVFSSLVVERSTDGGTTWAPYLPNGISVNDTAGIAPVLAIDPKKAFANGTYFDQLLFGTNTVYLSDTQANAFDAISPNLGGNISALAFAPSANGVYYAGLENGQVFVNTPNVHWANRSSGLPANTRIDSITVDPNNAGIAYVTLDVTPGSGTGPHVYQTTNAGQSWHPFVGTVTGAQLPGVPTFALVIIPPSSSQPNGVFYVGTNAGVYSSNDGGNSWNVLGQGLPNAPVVSLQYNASQGVLAAALQGRGVFTISTTTSGPSVTGTVPSAPAVGPTASATVTFNEPVQPGTFTTTGDSTARASVINSILSSTPYLTARATALYNQYLHLPPTQAPAAKLLAPYITDLNSGNGEISTVVALITSPAYLTYVKAHNSDVDANVNYLLQVYQDLFGVTLATTTDQSGQTHFTDTMAELLRRELDASVITITQAAVQLVGDPRFLSNLVATLSNLYAGTNYPIPVPTNNMFISNAVTQLGLGGTIRQYIDSLVGSDQAYLNLLNVYPLNDTTGTLTTDSNKAVAVVLGNFSGNTDSFGNPIPDLAVAEQTASGNDFVAIYQGLTTAGGGFSRTPTLILPLPAGATPTQLLVANLNGLPDLIVANGGLSSTSGTSVSVFLNNSSAGQLSFAQREDLNGGDNPAWIAAGNLDGNAAGNLDLAVADRLPDNSGNYNITILPGNGDGTFGAPVTIMVGSTTNSESGQVAPNGLAIGDLNGDGKPDIVLSGANGLVELTNTTTAPGAFSFSQAQVPLSSALATPSTDFYAQATTSVAIGPIDTTGKNAIVATTDKVGGEILIFTNINIDSKTNIITELETDVQVGGAPRDVQLVNLTPAAKVPNNAGGYYNTDDILFANDVASGSIEVLRNITQPSSTTGVPDTPTFAPAAAYSSLIANPTSFALGDINQDGLPDLVVGGSKATNIGFIYGQTQGTFQSPTDTHWITYMYQALLGRAVKATELSSTLKTLQADELVYLLGPNGSVAPLSITPTDSTDRTYSLTFPPLTTDGTYTLVMGTDALGTSIKDFIDRNGTFVNIGNAMNQNHNPINGQFPQDRFSGSIAVNTSDDAEYITGLFHDLMGTQSGGRSPTTGEFINDLNKMEPARVQALRTVDTEAILGTNKIASPDAFRMLLLSQLFSFFGMVDNNLSGHVAAIDAGTTTEEQIILQQVAGTMSATDAEKTMVSDLFFQYLGRRPVTNADPALNEESADVALLAKGPAGKGKLTPYEQLVVNLMTSPEYLALHGNTIHGWVTALNAQLTQAGSAIEGATDTLILGMYGTQRLAVATSITSTLEYRNRVYSNYYTQFFSTPAAPYTPTAFDLFHAEQVYQKNGKRLEAVQATILADSRFKPLNGPGSANSDWLNAVYTDLLFRGTTNDAKAAQYLAFLNLPKNTASAAAVAAARFTVANQILNSNEYRSDLIASYLNNLIISKLPAADTQTSFAFPPPPGSRVQLFKSQFDPNPITDPNANLVLALVKSMSKGMTQEAVVANIVAMNFNFLDSNAIAVGTGNYFLVPHQYP